MKKNNKFMIYILIIYLVVLVSVFLLLFPAAIQKINDMFKYDGELLLMLFLFIIIGISSVVVLLFRIISQANRDGEEKKYVSYEKLPDERKYLEREIISLNEKLVATEERWNTAYQLLISAQSNQSQRNGTISSERFLRGFGIDINEVTVRGNLVFVLTPFHPDLRRNYEIIKTACSNVNLLAVRSDEENVGTDILRHIIKKIVEARIIVANLDGRNANVFYELGIAHALNKPTILLSKVDNNVPFDVQGQYVILYESDSSLRKPLEKALLKMLTINSSD